MKDLITSRKFWGLLVGFILIVVLAFFPNFPEIGDHVTEIAVLTAAYIFGTAIDPRTSWKNKLLGMLYSRKFWAAFAGLAFIVTQQFVPNLPFTEEQVTAFIITLSTFIIGTGIQDKLASSMNPTDKARANRQ